jgi:ADP-ribose pyrophosphatase YjhB (NUDIX family)
MAGQAEGAAGVPDAAVLDRQDRDRAVDEVADIEPGSVGAEHGTLGQAAHLDLLAPRHLLAVDPERDPRARVITVTYFALIPWKDLLQPSSDKVIDLTWAPVHRLPKLAFDHKKIVDYAVKRLRAKAGYSNIVYGLMPRQFRLSELQRMYEIIINDKLDKRNFRKRMLATGLLQETGRKDIAGAHRPAMLYKFKKMEIAFLD